MRDRTDVKFILETTTRCGGSCQGCFLSARERTSGSLWTKEQFDKVGPFIHGYLEEHLKTSDPKEVSINLGQGDHLIAGPEKLTEVVHWIHEVGHGRSIGFMTASVIGKHERVARAVDAVRETALKIGQPIFFDLVIDPKKTAVAKFQETYAANIQYVRDAFGDVDLHINVGPDTVTAVTPEALIDFLTSSSFRRFTLNLTPTPPSAAIFAMSWEAITEWICRFLELWTPETGVEMNVGQVLSSVIKGADELKETGVAPLASIIQHEASRTIFLTSDGWIQHAQAGVGDIPCSDRVRVRPNTMVPDNPSSARKSAERSATAFSRQVIRQFKTNAACLDCEFSAVCPRIGALAISNALKAAMPSDCPSGLKPILMTIKSGGGKGDMSRYQYRRDWTNIPLGFERGAIPNGVPVARTKTELNLCKISLNE
ncbi:hypothetical protein [Roseibium sp. RKSG952]|uniref:hypothetical protein n=1 Tax=Roseibium sp. RKSG952 TaxID=2529384 RepID=UPI0012BC016A|nr:hypothetical protein [Roseibium sp. RKSG952]MTH96205.1 hypothetical protein [Roseibium sp. RKSG952]